MKISDLINCRSLEGAELIVGITNPDMLITGINILEATDIENWAKPGMVILTSYFALQNHSLEELNIFFEKMKKIGIPCLIMKVDRLVKEIPEQFIDLCKSYNIPLIRISGETKYEDIMVEVLTFILGIREQRLALYYEVSKISSQMTLERLGIQEILQHFKTFLDCDLMLVAQGKRAAVATNNRLTKLTLGDRLSFISSEYITYQYNRYQAKYDLYPDPEYPSVILARFPTEEGASETLVIQETLRNKINENEIVIIENLIRSLQLNLLLEYTGKQKALMNKNALVNDLLRGMITDPIEFNAACENLSIDPDSYCQVLTINYSKPSKNDLVSLFDVKKRLTTELKKFEDHIVYYSTPRYDQYILSFLKEKPRYFDIQKIRTLLEKIIEDEKFTKKISYCGGLSNIFPIREVSAAGIQSKAIEDFLVQYNMNNTIKEYKNLGLFKLFLGENTVKMNEIVPEEISRLHSDSKELFNTLAVYMKNNQNYKKTAESLYIHPKTVKYRIEKITKEYQLDLENIYSVTIILSAIDVIEFQNNGKSSIT